ncbi:MAG: HU family DNA-binding protein [Planctomycetota bacterium]
MKIKRIADITDALAEKHGLPKSKTHDLVNDVFEEIKNAIGDGEKVAIRNFANFAAVQRKPRRARNPKTGDVIFVPAKNAVRFQASSVLKDYLQTASRNVLVFSKDTGNFRDFLISNIEKIKCKPRVAPSVDETFRLVFDSGLQIYSIIIDSTVSENEARMVCNRVKMDKTEGIISIVRIKQEGNISDREALEFLADEIVIEPFEVDQLMGKIKEEVDRIADERGYFSQQVKLRVPTIVNEIEKTYDIMEEFFKKTNLEVEQVDELVAAYREAMSNAALHGNKNNAEKDLFVDFVVDVKKISFSIEDQGPGFDFTPFEKRAESTSAIEVARARNALDNPGGMGMMILKKCADEITYNTKGNKVSVIKHLNI